MPPRVAGAFRILGGLALGLLIWVWVFSAGEGGLGGSGGGWWPFGQGGGKGNVAEKPAEPVPPPKRARRAAADSRIRGSPFAGRRGVHDQRFYVLDHDPPRNLAELTKAVEQRKQARPALDRLDILIYKDSVDHRNPAVTELVRWRRSTAFRPGNRSSSKRCRDRPER